MATVEKLLHCFFPTITCHSCPEKVLTSANFSFDIRSDNFLVVHHLYKDPVGPVVCEMSLINEESIERNGMKSPLNYIMHKI